MHPKVVLEGSEMLAERDSSVSTLSNSLYQAGAWLDYEQSLSNLGTNFQVMLRRTLQGLRTMLPYPN